MGFLFQRNRRELLVGMILLGLLLGTMLFSSLLSSYDPLRGDLRNRLIPPLSPGHILGTDALGRDMLVRLLYGARMSLLMSGSGVIIGMLVGVSLGLIAGFSGGWIDTLFMRLVDVQLAFPFLLLALVIVTIVPASELTITLLLALAAWVLFARIIRASVRKEINREYVQAALTLGASRLRIALRYVLPNLLPTIVVIATLQLAALILFEATLSYLGVGIQPPTPSLGSMMLEGPAHMRSAGWITAFAGMTVFLMTLSLNLISEGLRDLLDPRLQR